MRTWPFPGQLAAAAELKMGKLAEKLNVVVVTIKWKLVPPPEPHKDALSTSSITIFQYPCHKPHLPTGCLACLMASSIFLCLDNIYLALFFLSILSDVKIITNNI